MCCCAVQVYSLRTPRMLLEDWKTECRKDGYYTTATHRIGGNYSYVMMTKKDMPNIQQIYLVRLQTPCCQPVKVVSMPGLDSASSRVSL